MFKSIENNQKGFSLIEVMVAMVIFVFAILIATSIFQQIATGQRREIAAQNAQETLRYITEVISKELRMAKKFTTGIASSDTCGERFGLNYSGNAGAPPVNRIFQKDSSFVTGSFSGSQLYFRNDEVDEECVRYFLSGDHFVIERIKADDTKYRIGTTTPANVRITNLKFNVQDSTDYSVVPKVTVLMDIISGVGNTEETLKLQTTITPRYYP